MNVKRKGLILVGIAVLSGFLVAAIGDTPVLAKHRNLEYRWIAASGMTLFGLSCNFASLVQLLHSLMQLLELGGCLLLQGYRLALGLSIEAESKGRQHADRGEGYRSGIAHFLFLPVPGLALSGSSAHRATWSNKLIRNSLFF